jgi:hypothetical protein
MRQTKVILILLIVLLYVSYTEQGRIQNKNKYKPKGKGNGIKLPVHKHKTKEIRDQYAQQKYRRLSKSKNKGDQHVAHTYPLELATHNLNHPNYKGNKDLAQLRKAINSRSNFKMRAKGTNLRTHRRIDKSLILKSTNGETLTAEESRRAHMQVAELKSNPHYPKHHVDNAFKNLYAPLVLPNGQRFKR